MGFDNECIVNIQSLAGEYFCPVCSALVYPNEALQSQCTHLYCKLCLTYVVRTTKACPYDGYSVTEKDSKPLVESDKALADQIGKTLVHCLFLRSGCSWLGPLSECTSHCSGCSFGDYPVVCNICGVQTIHRQTQEHAQSCPGGYQPLPQVQGQGQAVSQPQPLGHSHTQSFVQGQINAPQQSQLVTQPRPCVQVNTQTAALGHITQQQSNPQGQPHPRPYSMQPPGQQNLQAPSQGHQEQLETKVQPQLYYQPVLQSQSQSQPYPHPLQPNNPPSQQPAPSVVSGYQPHVQVNTQTGAQGHIMQQQNNPQGQPHPLPYSMQPPAQQNLQAPSQGHQSQLQTKVQPKSHLQPVLLSQPQTHPYPHPLQPDNPPSQQPAPSVVPDYQPHSPVQSHQQALQAPQQHYNIPVNPPSGSFPPDAQFPQQSPHVRPSQANDLLPNQQQPDQMLNQSQILGVPTSQHHQTSQQGYIGHQRRALLPLQQPSRQYEWHKKGDTYVLAQEHKLSHKPVAPQGPAANEYPESQDKGLMNSSNPATLTDQGRYQMPSGPYGPSSYQQRPVQPSNSQSGSYLGAPPHALPGQGPAHLKSKGPGLSDLLCQSRYPSKYYQGVQRGQYYQMNPPSEPPFFKTVATEPTGPLHGSDGSAVLQKQRLHYSKGRYPDPHLSESFDSGQFEQPLANEIRVPAFEAARGLHVKNVDDQKSQIMTGPGRIGQSEQEQDPKQFPKPSPTNIRNASLRAGDYPHEYNYETPLKFLPSYHPSGTSNAKNDGERPTGTQSDFPGSGPGFGADHLPPKSPGREYYDISSRGFAERRGRLYNQSGLDNIHSRGTYAVHEWPRSFDMPSKPVGKPLRDHFRSGDMAGEDFIPDHSCRVDFFGPRNVPSHFHGVDGFGTFPDPRMRELTGHGGLLNAPFVGNKSNHPRPGEPEFSGCFSLHGFSSSGGFYAGNLNSFDRFRNKMPTSMGWCRICKVDCDSVDGLDLHSQTTEHQQRTMDMVISIKQQNAKRQKTSKDHSSVEEGIRSRNVGNWRQGNKA